MVLVIKGNLLLVRDIIDESSDEDIQLIQDMCYKAIYNKYKNKLDAINRKIKELDDNYV